MLADVSDGEEYTPDANGAAVATCRARPNLRSKSVPAPEATPTTTKNKNSNNSAGLINDAAKNCENDPANKLPSTTPRKNTAAKDNSSSPSAGWRGGLNAASAGGHAVVHGVVMHTKTHVGCEPCDNDEAPAVAAAWDVATAAVAADSAPEATGAEPQRAAAAAASQKPKGRAGKPGGAASAAAPMRGSAHMHGSEACGENKEEEEDPADPLRRCALCRCVPVATFLHAVNLFISRYLVLAFYLA